MTKGFYLYACPECKKAYLSDVRRWGPDGKDITPVCEHTKKASGGVIGPYTVHMPTVYIGKISADIDT